MHSKKTHHNNAYDYVTQNRALTRTHTYIYCELHWQDTLGRSNCGIQIHPQPPSIITYRYVVTSATGVFSRMVTLLTRLLLLLFHYFSLENM